MHQVYNQAEARTRISWLWNSLRLVAQIPWRKASLSSFVLPCLTGIVLGIFCLVSPVLGLGLGLVVILFVTSLSAPILLCYLVISAIVLTSGIERGRLFPILTGNEIALLGAIAIAVLVVITDYGRKVTLPGYYWLAFVLLAGGTVFIPIATYLQLGTELSFNTSFKMASSLQYFLLFWLFTAIPKSESDRRRIVWVMLGFGMLVVVVGLVQGIGLGPVNRLLGTLYASSHEEMAARAGRVTSLLGSWNTLGIYLMTIILICWAVLFEISQPRRRLLIMGVMGLSVICLIASGSYAGVVGTAIGLIIIQLLSPHKMKSMPVLFVSFLAIVILILMLYPLLQPLIEKRLTYQFSEGLIPHTMLYRFKVWTEIFIPAIQQHFPLPVAPTVPSWYAWQFEESQYILLLFRTGLAGFVSYLTWILVTIGWLYRSFKRRHGFDQAIALAALAQIIVLVIAGFTNEVFSFSGGIDYLWIMLALVANGKEKIE